MFCRCLMRLVVEKESEKPFDFSIAFNSLSVSISFAIIVSFSIGFSLCWLFNGLVSEFCSTVWETDWLSLGNWWVWILSWLGVVVVVSVGLGLWKVVRGDVSGDRDFWVGCESCCCCCCCCCCCIVGGGFDGKGGGDKTPAGRFGAFVVELDALIVASALLMSS